MKKMNYDKKKLQEIYEKFKVDGAFVDVKPFGNGLINKTFIVKTDVKDYMLQIINSYAFHNVDDLMRNIYIVTNHLRSLGKATLHVRKTISHKIYVEEDGIYYRLYTFIKNTTCYDKLDSQELIFKAGEAFGDLHNSLADLDSILIAETIPNFHNTPVRYKNLMEAVKEDPVNRVSKCIDQISFIMSQKNSMSVIVDGLEDGTIPSRIVHNDPKINNVLFDQDSGDLRCVIDLDTIMPGSCLFDFGDALRSLFTGDNESNPDSSQLKVDLTTYETYTKGYLSKMKDNLTEKEINLLPRSIFVLACELATRFLEDYIRGDLYFKTSFDEENLIRAKGQLALAKDVLSKLDAMEKITRKLLEEKQ